MTIRLVIADDHPIMLEGIIGVLDREADLEIVARYFDGEATLAGVREHRPDILLLDLRMPRLSGISVLRGMVEEGLGVRSILLTAHISDDELLEAVGIGVWGVVLKDTAAELLIRCIRTVHAGSQWFEPHLTSRALTGLLAREAARQRVTGVLTSREIEIVRLVSRGLRNKEIAGQIGTTEGTVKAHLHRIYEKLGTGSRVELANYARQNGL
jgi:DNA-binding NarL/FixJ family response regulator